MEARILIHKSRKKAFFTIMVGVFTLAASFLSFTHGNDKVFGWIFLITTAFILIFGISTIRDRKPSLILTAQGITDLYSLREVIEWDAIVHVDNFFFRGQYFVRLLLPNDYKSGLIEPKWFWRLNRIYDQQGLKALYIRVSDLEWNANQLTDIIESMVEIPEEQRNDYLRKYKI